MPPETALSAESAVLPVALLAISPEPPPGLVDAWRRALSPIATETGTGRLTVALCDTPLHSLARTLARSADVATAIAAWKASTSETIPRVTGQDAPLLVDIRALQSASAASLLAKLGRPLPPAADTGPDPDNVLLPLAQSLIAADPNLAALTRTISAAFAVTCDPVDPAALALAAHRHLCQSLDDARTHAAAQALALERAMRATIAAQQAESQFPARLKNWQERFAESRATIDRLLARVAELEQTRAQPTVDTSAHAADRAALLARIAEMESSTSWRVTGPLRRASRLFRRR